jgi:DNA topoisomerase-3
MRRYTQKTRCRMLQLVEHFGDTNDAGGPCGLCDVCAPDGCVALVHRQPSELETRAADRILRALDVRDGQTVGQLHRDLFPGDEIDRRSLEHLLGGLVRFGRIRLEDDSFAKGGETIHFQRVRLASGGSGASPQTRSSGTSRQTRPDDAPHMPASFRIAERARPSGRRPRGPRAAREEGRPRRPRRASSVAPEAARALFEALRAWRLAEAKRAGIPAFRVLNDRTLLGVATETPQDEGALLRISGIGPGAARRYGAALLGIVARFVR